MREREFLEVDPADLHLPGGRRDGADRMKLHRQSAKYGTSSVGMTPLELSRGTDGEPVINDGVTRAFRIAKCAPGTKVVAEITGSVPVPVGGLPTVKERL